MNREGITGHRLQVRRLEIMMEKNMVAQTMLFSGMPGIGKKKVALRLLKNLFCAASDPPCLTCSTCIAIAKGTFPDVIELHPDEKGKIPIGNAEKKEEGSVRWLIDKMTRKSVSGQYGAIINGIDRVSIEGQNALLKTIEEPPEGAHIILTVTNKSQILPTILSRCSLVPFYPLGENEMREILANHGMDNSRIGLIPEFSGGSVELALLLADEAVFNEIIAFAGMISRYLENGGSLNFDIKTIQKNTGITDVDNIIMILVNIYRMLLRQYIGRDGVSSNENDPVISSIVVRDFQKLSKIIKILLALRKGYSNNLNIKSTLKGMLYSIDTMNEIGVPELAL
ncbi:MAG: hypothetical protein GY754_19335 [bacterium]|nr:hypothetical protein [bacterium]